MAAMGKDTVGRSRALPGLLALTLVACGGRYQSQGQGGGEPTGDDVDNGAGGSPSRGGSASSSGGGRGPGPTLGGMSSGVAGTGVALGGAVGAGGAVTGTAGTATGVAGSSPSNDDLLCKDVCSQRNRVCHDDLASCMSQCLRDLGGGDECSERKRETYQCLNRVFAEATDCKLAFYDSSKLCSASNGRPDDCGPACEEKIYGDAIGCHNVQVCRGGEADLQCFETGGAPSCTCWVNGMIRFGGVMADYDYAKAACLADQLIELCASFVK
jgi:hypothetical protein